MFMYLSSTIFLRTFMVGVSSPVSIERGLLYQKSGITGILGTSLRKPVDQVFH